jgi:hypothetical protein
MKHFFIIGILAGFVSFFVWNFQSSASDADVQQIPSLDHNKNNSAKNKQPVLIELFTSEGCPTCPPADRNLTFLETEQPFAEADLITLSLHVDYWNSRTWKDEFSSPMFSRRQDIYGQIFKISSVYTPQMIVDGQMQFAGTDLAKVQKAIVESAKSEKGKVELSTVEDKNSGTKLLVKISDLPKHEISTVFLAVAEDNLASNRTGSSGAKRAFTSVVRELKSLGFLSTEQKNLEVETFLQFQPSWKMENLKLVVFVQENGSRKVSAIGKHILTTEKQALN